MTRRKRRVRQPDVLINALFSADRRGETGDRYSFWVVLLIVLAGLAIMLAVAG